MTIRSRDRKRAEANNRRHASIINLKPTSSKRKQADPTPEELEWARWKAATCRANHALPDAY
jgi:hypothetical protein